MWKNCRELNTHTHTHTHRIVPQCPRGIGSRTHCRYQNPQMLPESRLNIHSSTSSDLTSCRYSMECVHWKIICVLVDPRSSNLCCSTINYTSKTEKNLIKVVNCFNATVLLVVLLLQKMLLLRKLGKRYPGSLCIIPITTCDCIMISKWKC